VRLVDKNSDADANTSTLSPTERIRLLRAVRTDASSSMTKTTGGTFAAVGFGVVNARISLASPRSAGKMRSPALADERDETSFLGLPDTLFPRGIVSTRMGHQHGLVGKMPGANLARSVTSRVGGGTRSGSGLQGAFPIHRPLLAAVAKMSRLVYYWDYGGQDGHAVAFM
jgi:hypothetical protein